MAEKTHWKKNNDSRYISGEDLRSGLKGLKPEMHVIIDRFEDSKTFDQNTQTDVVKTGFWLKELNGTPVYKPVILNNTNAKFCVKEFGSDYLEDWIGKPLTLYALADRRHGFVARFKKYIPPATVTDENALKILNQSTSIIELSNNWDKLSTEEKKLPSVVACKDRLKTQLK